MSKANHIQACFNSANDYIRAANAAAKESDYTVAALYLAMALENARGTDHRLLRAHIVNALELTYKARSHVRG